MSDTTSKPKAKSKKVNESIIALGDKARIALTTKRRKRVYWTYSKAMIDYNFRQLDAKSQRILLDGKTATDIMKEAKSA